MRRSTLISRRSFLRTGVIAGTVSLAGCIGLVSSDGNEQQSPTVLGEIELVNGHDEPHSVTVLVTAPEELIYLGTHDLQAYSSAEQDDVTLIEGPWQSEEALLTMDVIVDGDVEEGITAEDRETQRTKLGPQASGCIHVSVLLDSTTGLPHISEDDRGDYC